MAVTKSTDGGDNFHFIVSNGPSPPKELRTLIRKQAMRDAGLARKRRGGYGRINMRQHVVFEDTDNRIEPAVSTRPVDPATDSPDSGTDPPEGSHAGPELTVGVSGHDPIWAMALSSAAAQPPCILPTLSFDTGYERARSRFCVDLTQLSLLTNFNVVSASIPILTADRPRFLELISDYQYSYLEHVPAMYGNSECLAAATDCVLAKVQDVLAPEQGSHSSIAMQSYAKALGKLQEAIVDPEASTSPEVLCSIQLMALRELLDPSRSAAWKLHISGCARLVRHRKSTTKYDDEFEKALFVAHTGPVVSEALMNDEHCYLAEPEWIDLYSSFVQDSDTLTDRSQLVISGRQLMVFLPGLWCDVGKAVKGNDLYNEDAMSALVERAESLHDRYTDWLEFYKSYCVRTSMRAPTDKELALRREVYGATVECLAVVKRLLATVCDSRRISLEAEVQNVSQTILDIQHQPFQKHSWLFSGHEAGVAHTAMATKELYEEDLSHDTQERQKLATRRRYMLWNATLREPEKLESFYVNEES